MFLFGSDTFRSKQRLRQLKEGFKKKYDPTGSNLAVLDGEKLTLEKFRKAVSASGFLSSKRLVVVEEVIGKSKKKELQKDIVDYFESTDWNDDNIVIFWEADVATKSRKPKKKATGNNKTVSRSTRPLLKRLQGEKNVEEFPQLKGEQLNRWIQSEIRQLGGSIDSSALTELVSRVGSNLWQMTNEISKLVALRESKSIKLADVKQMVTSQYDENIFHLTDALASKDLKIALRLLSDQLASGAHELYILTMLVRQFRLLIQAHELIETEPHPATIASRLKIHPFVAQQLISQARKFTFPELKRIYEELTILDLKFKTSDGEPRLLFDLFATSVCAPQKA